MKLSLDLRLEVVADEDREASDDDVRDALETAENGGSDHE